MTFLTTDKFESEMPAQNLLDEKISLPHEEKK